MTSYDLQNKICYLILTLLDFQILGRKFLPSVTIVSLVIFLTTLPTFSISFDIEKHFNNNGAA